MTSALRVSTETAAPPAASWRITGAIRSISSRSHTGLAPGRVDSPPTSMIAAPCPAICAPASAAAIESANWPPSEKLSGVALTIPMTCGWSRRMVRSPSCSGARGEVSAFH